MREEITFKEVKKEIGVNNKDIAQCFGLSISVFANSSAKSRYEKAVVELYKLFKK